MTEPQERLFFALWPDEKVRQRLTETISGIPQICTQGRLVKPSNLHMTLHFLGNVPSAKVGCFLRQAIKVQGSPFNLRLTHIGYFKKPRVLWIGGESIPSALSQLHSDLGTKIEACGFTQESRPYRPHVTMARKINQSLAQQTIKGIPWSVDHFVLVQSIAHKNGVQYCVKASYPLRG